MNDLAYPLLKAHEVATKLNISRTEAYRLMKTEIPTVMIGNSTVRVRLSDLENYISGRVDNHERTINWFDRGCEALDRAQKAYDMGDMKACEIALAEYEFCRDFEGEQ